MQNVRILGITLQDRSLEEALNTSKRYLSNGALDVVAYVNHDVLMFAERNDSVRAFLEGTAMTLWEDKKILKLIGEVQPRRLAEIESRAYIRGLLAMLAKEGRTVALAGENASELGVLRDELLAIEPKLEIVHETLIESAPAGIPEADINSINEHSPAVVIARMDYGTQQEWLSRAGGMINAGIWLALPANMVINGQDEEGVLHRVWHKLSFSSFSRRAKKAMEG